MRTFTTAVVGGGASGIVAAISAARKGASVVICEKMPSLGKKVLASGNGRCNLLNEHLNESFYNISSHQLVESIFSRFGKDAIYDFFKELGLEMYSEEGRIFPVTNQSSSVLKVLEIEMRRLSVRVEPGFDVTAISSSKEGFVISSKSGNKVTADKVVLTGGGRTYPALGSDGSTYRLAAHFGHKIVEPVPAAVALAVKDPLCHLLQGQKIAVTAAAIIGGKNEREASGELLFTKYGLSGTAIIDVSEPLSIAIHRQKKKGLAVEVDMVPFMEKDSLKREIERRIGKGMPPEEITAGILPNKFGPALKAELTAKRADNIIAALKKRRFEVIGTRGWNEADFTAGGIDIKDVSLGTLESKLKPGLYFAGEVLDVNGRRGGYNLAWAWASGYIAGPAGR